MPPATTLRSVLPAEETQEILRALQKDVVVVMAQRRVHSEQLRQRVKAAKKALQREESAGVAVAPPELQLDLRVAEAAKELCIGANQLIRALEKGRFRVSVEPTAGLWARGVDREFSGRVLGCVGGHARTS